MADPDPRKLAAGYDDVLWSENTVETDAETLHSVCARAGRGWGVGALVVHGGGVLFVRHDGQWLLPGGMLEPGEKPAAGAVRETREETGIEVSVEGLAAVAEQTFTDGEQSFDFHFAVFDATAETTELAANPGIGGEVIDDVAWHDSLPENTFDRDLYVRLLDRDGA